MKYAQAGLGRVFIVRLEDGEVVHEVLEEFARDHDLRAAAVTVVGGADGGSRLVVGPERGRAIPVVPREHVLNEVHEVTGTGTIFPDEEGNPVLHLHLAAGRGDRCVTGCARAGVKVWHILEVILVELLDTAAVRRLDRALGFKLLDPAGPG